MKLTLLIALVCTAFISKLVLADSQDLTECSDPNAEYRDCGSACPLTCTNMNRNFMCIMVCRSGCFCRQGLVRNSNNRCIKPSECPQ
uniref:TIL domain-containing cysteine-rich salivary secreted peptide n=1 Tax=Aedes aegypti TaxID=7159 RepID=Q1HRK9_AEDAE|nr:TIL domain-containing cysteine-rich salivary secreted peptide [Aedes aegypti]